jgi:sulfonate transport system permease protein
VTTGRYGTSLRTSLDRRMLVVAAVGLVVAWEVAARIVAAHAARPDSILPTIEHTLSGFSGISNYWRGGLGVASTESGGPETLTGAFLALGDGVLTTGLRMLLGMALSVTLGVAVGLAIGYQRGVRRFAFGPLNWLGTLPLLATVPLFAFWFGATTKAAVLFILFGAGITILRATLNAVENVPAVYVDAARTLGASRRQVYRSVIVPAIMPELRGGIAIALTFSWSLALGAELVGIQTGLGRMMILSLRFSEVDRMVIIGAVFVALAATSVLLYERLADRVLEWAE